MGTSTIRRARGAALGAALAAALVAAAAGPAGAASGKGDYVGTWTASAQLGYAVPNTDEYAGALAWRLAVGYQPAPQFELDLELGRFVTDVDQPDAGGVPTHTIASGELDVRSICLTAQYRAPLPELLSTLTLSGGAGYYFVDYAMGAEPRAVFAALGTAGLPDQQVDDAWGFHLGAGLEYALTERFSLLADGRYLFLTPGTRGANAAGGSFAGELDLNTWQLTGGVKLVF
jgi:opacity protein-like surface antigen